MYGELDCVHPVCTKVSRLSAKPANPSYFVMPPQKLMARMLARTPYPAYLERGRGEGVICTVMERSVPPDLVEVVRPLLKYFNSKHCYYCIAGDTTLVEFCRLSLSNIAD
jgi:hypothetical protein